RTTRVGSLPEVVRELGEVRGEIVGSEVLEGLGNTAVETHPATRRELVIDRVAHERMHKAVAVERIWHLGNDPGGRRLFEGREDVVFGDVADPLEDIELEVAADYRGD